MGEAGTVTHWSVVYLAYPRHWLSWPGWPGDGEQASWAGVAFRGLLSLAVVTFAFDFCPESPWPLSVRGSHSSLVQTVVGLRGPSGVSGWEQETNRCRLSLEGFFTGR